MTKREEKELVETLASQYGVIMGMAFNMHEHGGGFVKALSLCFYHADPNNVRRLITAFPDYVAEYLPDIKKRKEI